MIRSYGGRPQSARGKKHGMGQYTLSQKYDQQQQSQNFFQPQSRDRSATYTPLYHPEEETIIDFHEMKQMSNQKRNTHHYHGPTTPNNVATSPQPHQPQMSLSQISALQQQLGVSSSDRRLNNNHNNNHNHNHNHNHHHHHQQAHHHHAQSPQPSPYHHTNGHNHNHNNMGHSQHNHNGYPSHYQPSPPISPQVIPIQQSMSHQQQLLPNFALPTSPQIHANASQPIYSTQKSSKHNHRSKHHHHHTMNNGNNNQLPPFNPNVSHSMSEQNVLYNNHNNGFPYFKPKHQHYPSTATTTNHYANSHYQHQQQQQQQQHKKHHHLNQNKNNNKKKNDSYPIKTRDRRVQSTPEVSPIPSPSPIPTVPRHAISEDNVYDDYHHKTEMNPNINTNTNSFYHDIGKRNNGIETPSESSSSTSHHYLADDEHSGHPLRDRTGKRSLDKHSKTSRNKPSVSKHKKTGIQPRSRTKHKRGPSKTSRNKPSVSKHRNKDQSDKKRRKRNRNHGVWGHRNNESNKYFKSKSSHLKLLNDQVTFQKNDATKKFLKKRIQQELLFENLPDSMIKKMVQKMYRVDIPPNKYVVKAGDAADAYFVIEKGVLEVWRPPSTKEGNNNNNSNHNDDASSEGSKSPTLKDTLTKGDTFGDNALLYATTHPYTYRAQASSLEIDDVNNNNNNIACRCWALDQETFDSIRKKQASTRIGNQSKLVKFLKEKILMFKDMMNADLQEISDAMMRIQYRKNDKIVCQGDSSTHFFIIYRGTCDATKKLEKTEIDKKDNDDDQKINDNNILLNNFGEKILKSYGVGDCFGELGIMKSQSRAATVRVTSDQLIAFALPALDFKALLDYDVVAKSMNKKINQYNQIPAKYKNRVNCKLDEFKEIGCLGVGAFGRVTLVENPEDQQVYALKRVRKNRIVETSQQEHIINEKRIMAALDSVFCIKLFATFKDELNVYFLLEPVMGGELFSLLRHEKKLKQRTATFYCACVVLAFDYLHSKLNVIYRDLKPENLLISTNGYCKLVDFGFAKKRNNTCTLCGTPQYLAPEVIQNLSHGFAVDWWSVGILIYEMIFGFPPFEGDKNMKMYEKILTAPVEFPQQPQVRSYTKEIINLLLRKQAHKRLGAGTKGAELVKKHRFFQRIDWNKMLRQEIDPPWKPRIKDTHDLSAFDRFPDTTPENEQLIHDPDGQLFKWCDEF